MKICKKCGKQIENDALVCPYCGCVNREETQKTMPKIKKDIEPVMRNSIEGEPQKKKRKIWLWILGWLFIFPLPLTVLLYRNKKMNKIVKIIIIIFVWLFYLPFISAVMGDGGNPSKRTTRETASETEEQAANEIEKKTMSNIRKLEFTDTKDVTVNVGESSSNGYLKTTVRKKKDFTPEDIVFVSEDTNIASINCTEVSGTYLYYDIVGVDGGETNVYAESKDGSVRTKSIHVIVPMPIRVEKIEIKEIENTDLVVGETIETEVSVSPYDAEDKTITWTSSAPEVATVNEEGIITAVGGGEATIKASSSNGIEDSFDITVDGSKTLMKLTTNWSREDDANIGDEWSYDIEINGERPSRTIGVGIDETLSFSAEITESDKNPDVGTGSASHIVTEDDIENGFEISFDVYVTENGGKNSGQSAHFIVTYNFSPIE